MRWLEWIIGSILLALLALASLALHGSRRWAKATRELHVRLDAGRVPPQEAVYAPHEVDGLPDPVRRYVRAVLQPGQPIVTAVQLTHAGTFNQSATAERWIPFTSAQRVVIRRPGFVWNARMALVPGVTVRVHDAYIEGEGYLRPAILGLFPLANLRGRGELAHGELMRFLAEAAWYPTALLPRQGLRWEAIDDRCARATLVDGDNAVSLSFRFNDEGLIETVHADARGRLDGDRVEQLPWEGRFWNYAVRDGMRVPLEGEVAWLTPTGRKPYWRGTIQTINYEFAR
jgi:hypothetical protein